MAYSAARATAVRVFAAARAGTYATRLTSNSNSAERDAGREQRERARHQSVLSTRIRAPRPRQAQRVALGALDDSAQPRRHHRAELRSTAENPQHAFGETERRHGDRRDSRVRAVDEEHVPGAADRIAIYDGGFAELGEPGRIVLIPPRLRRDKCSVEVGPSSAGWSSRAREPTISTACTSSRASAQERMRRSRSSMALSPAKVIALTLPVLRGHPRRDGAMASWVE